MNNQSASSSFIYNIEVLIEDKDHAAALVQLLQRLNETGFADYKILSGIQLGNQIEERKALAATQQAIPIGSPKKNQEAKQNATSAPPQQDNNFEPIRALMKNNKLIRLIVNKGFGIKASIPCRIINMDEKEALVTVYHVDEKQVYTFRLTEIEDFIAN